MYSDVAKSFNVWIKKLSHLLVTRMVDSIRLGFMYIYIYIYISHVIFFIPVYYVMFM